MSAECDCDKCRKYEQARIDLEKIEKAQEEINHIYNQQIDNLRMARQLLQSKPSSKEDKR